MFLDQPRDQFRVGRVEAEPRTQPTRNLRARDRVVFGAAFRDIVQQRGHINDGAMLRADFSHQVAGHGELIDPAAFDVLKNSDAAKQMFIDRVVMIHIELHH